MLSIFIPQFMKNQDQKSIHLSSIRAAQFMGIIEKIPIFCSPINLHHHFICLLGFFEALRLAQAFYIAINLWFVNFYQWFQFQDPSSTSDRLESCSPATCGNSQSPNPRTLMPTSSLMYQKRCLSSSAPTCSTCTWYVHLLSPVRFYPRLMK